MRDARKPIIPIGVEQDESHNLLLRSGEERAAYNVTLDPEDVGRIKAGYACCRCYEIQDTPFPEACWVCGFPMKERQNEYLAKAYQGSRHMGPSTSMEDELAALEELEERQARQSSISVPTILVPGMW